MVGTDRYSDINLVAIYEEICPDDFVHYDKFEQSVTWFRFEQTVTWFRLEAKEVNCGPTDLFGSSWTHWPAPSTRAYKHLLALMYYIYRLAKLLLHMVAKRTTHKLCDLI